MKSLNFGRKASSYQVESTAPDLSGFKMGLDFSPEAMARRQAKIRTRQAAATATTSRKPSLASFSMEKDGE